MTNYLAYLLLGVGNGAVYAALATALVVTYRSSGVINFAAGSIGLYAAYTFGYMCNGQLLILIPGLPSTVDLPFTPGVWPAMAMAVSAAALLGLALYLLVFRPLRSAPPVARLVASIGVQLVLILLVVEKVGTNPLRVESIFPDDRVRWGQTVIQLDRVWFAVTVVVLALGLGALFKFTRFGLSTRAAAETEKGAIVSGISPTRIAALNWMLSAAVAGLAGILIAPLVSLVPVAYSLLIVPALAAAVLGGFERLAPAAIGGLLIGMLQSEAEFLKVKWDWFPSSGAPEAIPLGFVLLVLVLRGKALPERGTLIRRTLGRAPRPRSLLWPTVVAVVAAAILLLAVQGQWRTSLVLSFVLATISLSFVVVTGYCGQISLAQLTLAGTAAYSLSVLTTDWGVPFPIAPVLAATVSMVIGVVVGLPALRVRGLSVAVVTLALAVALDAVWFRNSEIVGSSGGVSVEPPSLFGFDLGWGAGADATHLRFGFLALGVLTLTALGVAVLRRSPLGSAMVAVRANERSAAAAGINVARTKLVAFALGSFIAGIGGSMLAYRYRTVTYDQFTPLIGLSFFAAVYLAGITSISGGIAAGMMGVAGIIYYSTNELIPLGDWYELLTAALLIVTVIANPEGLMGPNHHIADRIEARRRRRRGPRRDVDLTLDAGLTSPTSPTQRPVGNPGEVVLRLRDVSVTYGGVRAVSDVSFDVASGTIVGLIGPNGAGKTSLVDAISGFTASTGEISYCGERIDDLKPHQRVGRGLGRTFQAIELYDDLSVHENLQVGLAGGTLLSNESANDRIERTVAVLGIGDLVDLPAGELSQGQRQLVSIGRTLVAQPQLVLLDEPAAGLDSNETGWLGERLREVRDAGTTILMVDHDVDLVLNLCDQIVVLDFGEVISSGTPPEVRADPRVIEAYLGSSHERVPQ